MALIEFDQAWQQHQKALASVMESSQQVEKLLAKIISTFEGQGKVLWLGNGGSAADAQHMAAEMMVRYVSERQPLPAIALTTDSSILTAHSNDFAFESVFARQIEALAQPQDVVIAMSTSGTSANVVAALKAAQQKGCFCVAMTGKAPSALAQMADWSIQVNSDQTARVQEAHTFLNHLICEGLDRHFS